MNMIQEMEALRKEAAVLLDEQIARHQTGGEGFHNPFAPWLPAVNAPPGRAGLDSILARDFVTEHVGWGVYSEESLQKVADFAPEGIVEVGAGNGAWAYGLKQLGVEVEAFDLPTPTHGKGHEWHPIRRDLNHEDAAEKAAREGKALMIVWPYMHIWAAEALFYYRGSGGKKLIYVGEGYGGCTADQTFFDLMGDGEIEHEFNPSWFGIHDLIHLVTFES